MINELDEIKKCKKEINDILGNGNITAKYIVLLIFVKTLQKRSCCNICECIACDAKEVLREIQEDENAQNNIK